MVNMKTPVRRITPAVVKTQTRVLTRRQVTVTIMITCSCWLALDLYIFFMTDFGYRRLSSELSKLPIADADLAMAKRQNFDQSPDVVNSLTGPNAEDRLPNLDEKNLDHRRKHELRRFYLDKLQNDPRRIEGADQNKKGGIVYDKNGVIIQMEGGIRDKNIISDQNGFVIYADANGDGKEAIAVRGEADGKQGGGLVDEAVDAVNEHAVDDAAVNAAVAEDGERHDEVAAADSRGAGAASDAEKHEMAPAAGVADVNDGGGAAEVAGEDAVWEEGQVPDEEPPQLPDNNPLNDLPELIWEKVRDLDIRTLPYLVDGQGERGRPALTSERDRVQVAKQWVHAEFNEFISDHISLERSLKDTRPQLCKEREYPYNALPRTSIIICFTDESWSTLMRTVHSVLNRSPPELVEEVILVDDFSQEDYLKQQLDDYIVKLRKVRVVRLAAREGLIRARLAGISASRAPVITFLDSHVEVQVGWLEPLLDRIRRNRTTVPAPVIDTIDANTLSYGGADEHVRGVFSWHALQFRWKPTPKEILNGRKHSTDPIDSPTMAGGLFSMDKSYFYELGGYDPGLEIWGAENMELSFKVWLCGGKLEIVPCSHVGHIFRQKQPYKFPSGDNISTFMRNTLRVVDVWLDDYTEVFYSVNGNLRAKPHGDISERLAFKETLKCHKFDWYVKNVFKDLEVPNSKLDAEGELRNGKFKMACLDAKAIGGRMGLGICHGMGGNQQYRLSNDGHLQYADRCIYKDQGGALADTSCSFSGVTSWLHTKGGPLQDKRSKKCLTAHKVQYMVTLEICSGEDNQNWTFGRYTN